MVGFVRKAQQRHSSLLERAGKGDIRRGAYLTVSYAHVGQRLQYMRSVKQRKYTHRMTNKRSRRWRHRHAGWKMALYAGPPEMSLSQMTRVPADTRGLSLIGESRVHQIHFTGHKSFAKLVPKAPSRNFVWVFGGRVRIREEGTYRFCVNSDDGSKMWIDGDIVVNDDGLHGPIERCGQRHMPKVMYMLAYLHTYKYVCGHVYVFGTCFEYLHTNKQTSRHVYICVHTCIHTL